jgi:hypothetical protein
MWGGGVGAQGPGKRRTMMQDLGRRCWVSEWQHWSMDGGAERTAGSGRTVVQGHGRGPNDEGLQPCRARAGRVGRMRERSVRERREQEHSRYFGFGTFLMSSFRI